MLDFSNVHAGYDYEKVTPGEFVDTVLNRFSSWENVREDINTEDWGRKYLSHYYKNKRSKMHQWVFKQADKNLDGRGFKMAYVGPRGGAKSVCGTLTIPLRRAVEGSERHILITSDTKEQANDHLASIKEELETNYDLQQRYPKATGEGPVWRQDKIKLNNGVVIRTGGTLSRLRGLRQKEQRPSLVIGDDLENDQHITSTTMRGKTWTWFSQTLANIGDSKTNFIMMGTSLHRECLILKLLRASGWVVPRDKETKQPTPFKAILRWPSNTKLWEKWKRIYLNVDNENHVEEAKLFYMKNKKAMDKGAILLWPDREPLYMLMCLMVEIGRLAFESEKQGNPINPESCEWEDEYFEDIYFKDWEPASSFQMRVVSLDPSKGKKAKIGDYSAIAKVGFHGTGRYYADLDMQRRTTTNIVADYCEAIRKFRPHYAVIETNQFQELLAIDIREEMERLDLDVPIVEINNTVNKNVRIRRLTPYLSKGILKLRQSDGSELCVRHMRDWPNSDHDDGMDALEQGIRVINEQLDIKEVDSTTELETLA